MEPGDEAEGVETTSSALVNFALPPKGGSFTLHNYQTNLCLGVAAGNPNPGTKLVTWACDGTANQNWQEVNPLATRTQIRNMIGTNKCLDITRGSQVTYTNGSAVDIDNCDAATAQAWTVTATLPGKDFWGHQCYQFADQYGPTGKPLVVGVSGGNPSPGAPVIMWENFANVNTHPDQYWCVY